MACRLSHLFDPRRNGFAPIPAPAAIAALAAPAASASAAKPLTGETFTITSWAARSRPRSRAQSAIINPPSSSGGCGASRSFATGSRLNGIEASAYEAQKRDIAPKKQIVSLSPT